MEDFKFDFEKLSVYQKSLDFIDDIFALYRNLDRDYRQSIGNNLIRAAMSIANNLAEGNDEKSKREKRRFFTYSSDSARECVSVLNVLKRQKILHNPMYSTYRINAREITSMIRGLIESNE